MKTVMVLLVANAIAVLQPNLAFSINAIPSSDVSGPTPQDLAEAITDTATGLTVEPGASTIIGGTLDVSDSRAMGVFSNGNITAGAPLPSANQVSSETYAGGIGINSGICLSTGYLTDDAEVSPSGFGVGIEGPNNGYSSASATNVGEISKDLEKPQDDDFVAIMETVPNSTTEGDATVLEFDVTMEDSGCLIIEFAFGSDEYNAWTSGYNDSFIVLIDGDNIATSKMTTGGITYETPITLADLASCGAPIFIENQVAPAPSTLPLSLHANSGTEYYDHEFGGFTKVLRRESATVLPPGTYTIKIVVQDVTDRVVDSAVFVPDAGLRLFKVCRSDFNNDGVVDIIDLGILGDNYGMTSGADKSLGDANGDGAVDLIDLGIIGDEYGMVCNKDLEADFDRSGHVGDGDLTILLNYWGMAHCASRFEGDANGDGAVGDDDLTALLNQWGM